MKRDYALADLPEKPQNPWRDETAIRPHAEWWEVRRARQTEIDASVARQAEADDPAGAGRGQASGAGVEAQERQSAGRRSW